MAVLCSDNECRQTIEEYLATQKFDDNACLIVDMDDLTAGKMEIKTPAQKVIALVKEGSSANPKIKGAVKLQKPFRLQQLGELLNQTKQNGNGSKKIALGAGLEWLESEREIRRKGGKNSTHLTEKEGELLSLLLRMKGKVVDRETLLSEVWKYQSNVVTNTLETHIWRLKEKIEGLFEPGKCPLKIHGEQGGYRLEIEA